MLWAGLLLTLMGCVLFRLGALKVYGSPRALPCSGHRRQCAAGVEPVLYRGRPRPAGRGLVARRHRHRGIRPVGDRDPVGRDTDSTTGRQSVERIEIARAGRSPFFSLLLAAAIVPLLPNRNSSAGIARNDFPGWPDHYEGRALTELPLTERELAFMRDFPGRVGRFSDGRREIIIRWVNAPTRRLHSAADCFRGSGYSTTPLPIKRDATGAAMGVSARAMGPMT